MVDYRDSEEKTMVTLKDVRDDLRDAKTFLERRDYTPQQVTAVFDKAISDLQDIEAALTQVMIDVEGTYKARDG